jgi:hypothetical protein
MVHIIIHTLPYELNALEQTLIQLKRSSQYLNENHKVRIEVLLNMNLVNWNLSKIGRWFFEDAFSQLIKLNEDWAECVLRIDDVAEFLGCNDLRRHTIRNTDADYIMYLDTDVIFNNTFLRRVFDSIEAVTNPLCIITPQLTRMWDTTWDIVSNESFFNEEANHENYFNRDPYKAIQFKGDVKLKPIQEFKFAGWGTTISTKLARLIDIPDALGPYGLDDTFIMYGCKILKRHNIHPQQYIIENEIVIENNKFKLEYFKELLTLIDRKEEFTKTANNNFQAELIKLDEKFTNRELNQIHT